MNVYFPQMTVYFEPVNVHFQVGIVFFRLGRIVSKTVHSTFFRAPYFTVQFHRFWKISRKSVVNTSLNMHKSDQIGTMNKDSTFWTFWRADKVWISFYLKFINSNYHLNLVKNLVKIFGYDEILVLDPTLSRIKRFIH